MRALRRLAALAGPVVLLLAGGLGVNIARQGSLQPDVGPAPGPAWPGAPPGAVERLSRALVFPTLSEPRDSPDPAPFHGLHAFIRQAYPAVHAQLDVERVAGLSLLYTWRGSDAALPPIVLLGHLDVVPAPAAATGGWRHAPFGGDVADGFVWGRGALDDKGGVLATLEAVELLLSERFRPRRTVYLAFGHDEESSGQGARAIVRTLRGRGVNDLALVLDEGGAILPGALIPGIDQPVALIGIAEKRSVDLELTVRAAGGHSSAPPAETAIGVLSRAVAALEASPPPARLDGATAATFRYLAPEMPLANRVVFANPWLFGPLVTRVLAGTPRTAAIVRTTLAPTVFEAGVRFNVLPTSARAVVNARLVPGDTAETVVAHAGRVIDDDRVRIRAAAAPLPPDGGVSATGTPAFDLLARTVRETYGGSGVLVAPYLTIAAVDARWYAPLTPNVYRFRGMPWEADATERVHGPNERIAVEAYLGGIRFLHRLLRNASTL